jgi:preprotein translocase subunit SecG
MNARLALITIIGLILSLVVGVLLHDEETGAIMA